MKILAILLVTGSMFLLSYFTMVYGWGLEPTSLAWIIWSYIGTIAAQIVISELGKGD